MAPDLRESEALLVDAYLRHYAGDESAFWAFSEVNKTTFRDAERGWSITLALIAAAPDDRTLGYVAAGPLEEVLEVHGERLIDRVENLVHHDEKFRRALSLVACFEDSMPQVIRTLINKALGRI